MKNIQRLLLVNIFLIIITISLFLLRNEVVVESPTPTPWSYGVPYTPSPEPRLEVQPQIEYVNCSCDGKQGEAQITLLIKNGVPPYQIYEKELVKPVLGNVYTTKVALSSELVYIIESSDNQVWTGMFSLNSECKPPPVSCAVSLSPTPANTLVVDIQTEVVYCECGGGGNYGTVLITINFINGEPIYKISGQEPVRSRIAKFQAPLGSDLYLILTSSDGLLWEGPVDIPRQCTPPKGQCVEQKTPEPPSVTQCNDGRDNDFDGKKDYPDDPGCDSPTDNSEWPFNWP